jgi:endonuclease/exonuclease/phosphatase family metal-dependent hydrolase
MQCVLVRLLPLLLLSIFSVAGSQAADPIQVRVLSYNIHHGEGVDRKLDLQRIARIIKSVEPDIVALQEVDKKTMRTNKVDQPAGLAKLTEMNVVFERNIEFEGGQYGNAILSKWPIKKHKNHHLPSMDDGEQRGVLLAEIQPTGWNTPIYFLATHLDHRPNDKERMASSEMINKLIQNREDAPAILAGDLNDTPDSRTLSRLGKSWQRANRKVMPTVPVTQPKRQIDYILFRPVNRWKTIEVRVLDEAVASDHRAIFAVLELNADK